MPVLVKAERSSPVSISELRWGVLPSWSADHASGSGLINARSETVELKPTFKDAFTKRRCLVLTDGFFEWKREGRRRYPYFIESAHQKPFVMAGLWEEPIKHGIGEGAARSFAILTKTASDAISDLHDRMPVILDSSEYETWLDPSIQQLSILRDLLRTSSQEPLCKRPVSTFVNQVSNEGPQCLEGAEERQQREVQQRLF